MKKPLHIGKRLTALLLCLVSLFCLLPNPPAATAEEVAYATVVRNYAYPGASVIGQLENGTIVRVLGTYNNFFKIDCYDMMGYIAANQLIQDENGIYYVNCQPGSSETTTIRYENMRSALELRLAILSLADKQLGTPYVYGGSRPGGFDCSGFTAYVYGQYGYTLSRRASTQLQDGIAVPKEAMMAGDLVFFREAWEPYEASHVGIYAGNNTIIHASSSLGISYASLDTDWFAENFLCARRVINTPNVQIPDLEAPATDTGSCVVRSISGRTAH